MMTQTKIETECRVNTYKDAVKAVEASMQLVGYNDLEISMVWEFISDYLLDHEER